jgi:hypothetical protein
MPKVGAAEFAVKLKRTVSSLAEIVKDFPAVFDFKSRAVLPPEPVARSFQALAELNVMRSWFVTPSPRVSRVVGADVPNPNL